MSLIDDINDIPALAAFNAEPLPQVPVEQRVRELLSNVYGPVWQVADVFAYCSPSGYMIYLACTNGVIHVVGERANGSLGLATPMPDGDIDLRTPFDEDEEQDSNLLSSPAEQDYRNEQQCLKQILPALIEASNIIAGCKEVKPTKRMHIKGQIAHACKHLSLNLENMRPTEGSR